MTKQEPRTIEDYHRTRESGTGCPETDGGPHYFAHLDFRPDSVSGRICIDCGEPEPARQGTDPENSSTGGRQS